MTRRAKFIKAFEGPTGPASLYRITPPIDGAFYVVAMPPGTLYDGIETMIFPATARGRVTKWAAIDGYHGATHSAALESLGYKTI